MALTKAKVKEILSKAGVEAENMDAAVDSILNGHIASIDALREERDGYKKDAERLPDVQKELDDLKKAGEGKDDFEPVIYKFFNFIIHIMLNSILSNVIFS